MDHPITDKLNALLPPGTDLQDRTDPAMQALHAFFEARGMKLMAAAPTLTPEPYPTEAPEKWTPRGKELPEDFAVRVYGKWMKPDNTGISMAEILHLDLPLYHSLRRSPREIKPDGYFLPSKGQQVRATIESVREGRLPMPEDYRTRNRLASSAWRIGQSLAPKK